MPVLGLGAGIAQGQQVANQTRQVQMQAERDRRLFEARDTATQSLDVQAEIDRVATELNERANAITADWNIGELKKVGLSMLDGDLSELNDSFNIPALKELYLNDNGIKARFGGGIQSVTPYNSNNPQEVAALKKYMQEVYGSDTNDEVDTSKLLTYKRDGDGEVVVDDNTALVRALGLAPESTKIRQILGERDEIEAKQQERLEALKTLQTGQEEAAGASEEAKKKAQLAQQKLAIEEGKYKPDGTADPVKTAKDAATAYKALRDSGASPETVASIMSNFGVDVNQPEIKKQMDAEYESTLSGTAEERSKHLLNIAKIQELGNDKAQMAAYNEIGDKSGYGKNSGALVKDLIDTGKYGIGDDKKLFQFTPKADKDPVFKQKIEEMQGAETELNNLMGDDTSFSDLDPNRQQQFRSLRDQYAVAAGIPPLAGDAQSDISFGYRFIEALNRFSKGADGSVRGVIDDMRNLVSEYTPTASPERRRAIQLNLAALLGAVRLDDDRTPKFVYDEMRSQLGAEFGKSFPTVVEGAISALEDLRAEFNARSGPAAGNNFDAILYKDVLSKSEPSLTNLKALLKVSKEATPTEKKGVVKRFGEAFRGMFTSK